MTAADAGEAVFDVAGQASAECRVVGHGDLDVAPAVALLEVELDRGAGHLPQLEQAERTIGLITDFLG